MIDNKEKLIIRLKDLSWWGTRHRGKLFQTPKRNAVFQSIDFVKKLPRDVKLPTPLMSIDGVVSLWWEARFADLFVEFHGERYIYYTAKMGYAGIVIDDSTGYFKRNEIPKGLLKLIRQFR